MICYHWICQLMKLISAKIQLKNYIPFVRLLNKTFVKSFHMEKYETLKEVWVILAFLPNSGKSAGMTDAQQRSAYLLQKLHPPHSLESCIPYIQFYCLDKGKKRSFMKKIIFSFIVYHKRGDLVIYGPCQLICIVISFSYLPNSLYFDEGFADFHNVVS